VHIGYLPLSMYGTWVSMDFGIHRGSWHQPPMDAEEWVHMLRARFICYLNDKCKLLSYLISGDTKYFPLKAAFIDLCQISHMLLNCTSGRSHTFPRHSPYSKSRQFNLKHKVKPGIVAKACSTSYLGGWGGETAWARSLRLTWAIGECLKKQKCRVPV
jgi:hypothetical protein